jgi:hypothetical protein
MTTAMTTRRRLTLVALVAIVLGSLLTVAMWASTRGVDRSPYRTTGGGMMGGGYGAGMTGGRYGGGMMGGGGGMMAGAYALPGDGRRVTSLAAARQRAQLFADRLGLRTGEVLQFSNGFYAELLTADGAGATEVLVEAANGAVAVEFGPAMMWNTSYGMHPAGAAAPAVSAAQARRAAQRWLDDQRRGLTAGEPEQFPGYYTLETLRGEKIDGMMSVNATTGAVWYHTWHGSFVAASEE